MNLTLDANNIYLQTDSNGNKVMIQQGVNNSLTLAENTGTATFFKAPAHPTPATSSNDTQSATTEYVRAYCQTLNIGRTSIADNSSMISGNKASTFSLDLVLATTGTNLQVTTIVFTAIYLTAGIQFNKYNIIAASTSAVPLRFALFGPDGAYVSNSDTGSYNGTIPVANGLITSTLSNPLTIATSGVYYIFYQSNAIVGAGKYYSSTAQASANIINFWRSGTLSNNGPYRSFYASGASLQNPATFGNILTYNSFTLLSVVNLIFLTYY